MNIKTLSRLYEMSKFDHNLTMKIYELETAVISAQDYDDMPKASGGISSQVENISIELADLKKMKELNEEAMQREKCRLQELIDTIKKEQIKEIFGLRFIHFYTWDKIAKIVGDRYTSADSIRMKVSRYIKKRSHNIRKATCLSSIDI